MARVPSRPRLEPIRHGSFRQGGATHLAPLKTARYQGRLYKVFDRTVLEAAKKMQKGIEELRQAKESCRQLELSFGDVVERPGTPPDEHPAFTRLAASSLSGQQLASTLS